MARPKVFSDEWLAVRVDRSGDCWIWLAAMYPNGYGAMVWGGERYAHRCFYKRCRGPIGDSHVLHKCDVRNCVNPDHLFLGSSADNMRDMDRKGRRIACANAGETKPCVKLSDEQAEELKRLADTGVPRRVLAKVFGLSRTQTGVIARGRRKSKSDSFKRVFEPYATVITLR